MTTAHNENQTTFSFSTQEFPRHSNLTTILRDAEQLRAAEVARLGKAFGRFIKRTIIAPVVVAYERQRMYEELNQLSDRVLDDIGVARGNIAQVVDAAFPRHSGEKAAAAKTTLHSLDTKHGAQTAQTASNDHTHHPLAA